MGNFAENLNLGNRFRPPLYESQTVCTPSSVRARSACDVTFYFGKSWGSWWSDLFLIRCEITDFYNKTFESFIKVGCLYCLQSNIPHVDQHTTIIKSTQFEQN